MVPFIGRHRLPLTVRNEHVGTTRSRLLGLDKTAALYPRRVGPTIWDVSLPALPPGHCLAVVISSSIPPSGFPELFESQPVQGGGPPITSRAGAAQ